MPDREERLKIEENIQQLEQLKASGAMPAALADASIAMWQEKLVASANLEGDGAIAQGNNSNAAGQDAFLVSGGVEKSNIIHGDDNQITQNNYYGTQPTKPLPPGQPKRAQDAHLALLLQL